LTALVTQSPADEGDAARISAAVLASDEAGVCGGALQKHQKK
jgi:hypothetical protein